jgi:hypothetical protein
MRVLREKKLLFFSFYYYVSSLASGGVFSVIAKDKHCGRVCAPTSIEWALSLISNCWIAHIARLLKEVINIFVRKWSNRQGARDILGGCLYFCFVTA